MAIVSSTIAADSAQKDGRRWIEEIHTDQAGITYPRFYLAQAADNAATNMAAYAIILWANIQAAEIAQNISNVTTFGSLANYTLNYTTAAQNFAALRSAYLISTQTQVIMIGDFLHSLTSLQLQAAFGMTAGQVTTLMTNKLTPASVAAATIRSATGA